MAERPSGALALRHFKTVVSPMPPGPAGAVLLRNIFVSIAPHARAVMQGPTYRPQLVADELIPSSVIAEVIAGPADGPAPGSVVAATAGWQEYSVVPAPAVRPLQRIGRLSHHLGLLGLNGLTAYFGIREVAKVRVGETVVISAAAGGVGHLAGQVARLAGGRVVGITSSDEKNRILENQLGYSATVNWRSSSFLDDLHRASLRGVDVYFDNVGGPLLENMLPLIVNRGRIVCCGVTAQYDMDNPLPRPSNLAVQMIAESLRMEGFLVANYRDNWNEALRHLNELHESGQLTVLEDLRHGLASAPTALIEMLAGKNVGQLAVRLAPDPMGWPSQ